MTKPVYIETKDYVNPTPNQIKKVIIDVIKKVEKGARARKIPVEFVEKTIEDMFSKRAGGYLMVGGYVAKSYRYPAESTEAKICWAWRRGKLALHYNISRSYAKKRSYGGGPEIEPVPLEECYRELYPLRWAEYCRNTLIRELRKYGIRYFPEKYRFSVREWKIVDGIEGCVLVTIDGGNDNFVATNAGWVKLKSPLPRSLRAACVRLGFDIANKNQINVKEIEDYAIMKALEEA